MKKIVSFLLTTFLFLPLVSSCSTVRSESSPQYYFPQPTLVFDYDVRGTSAEEKFEVLFYISSPQEMEVPVDDAVLTVRAAGFEIFTSDGKSAVEKYELNYTHLVRDGGVMLFDKISFKLNDGECADGRIVFELAFSPDINPSLVKTDLTKSIAYEVVDSKITLK